MKDVWPYLSVTVLMLTGILLIFIILLQRGRGGGLAGAFGGAGGQSALGTKAGDVFTRITIGLAVIWVLLACLSIYALRAGAQGDTSFGDGVKSAIAPPAAEDEETEAAGGTLTSDLAGEAKEEAKAETPAIESATTDPVDADGPALGTPPTTDEPASDAEKTPAPAGEPR